MFEVNDRRQIAWCADVRVTCRETLVISTGSAARDRYPEIWKSLIIARVSPGQLETSDTILPTTDGIGRTSDSEMQFWGRGHFTNFIHRHPFIHQHPEDADKYNAEPIVLTPSGISWLHTSEG